jgi:hypothetical protein
VYFWANQGDELQPKKVVKSEIELGLPFMALDQKSEYLSYKLMFNSGKKIRALHDKINKYSNSCVV